MAKTQAKQAATNLGLRGMYDEVYREGSTEFYTFDYFPESLLVFSGLESWQGLRVLEVGCGEGRLAALIGMAGAERVDAIDYSESAIAIAKERFHLDNVQFACKDFHRCTGEYDVVIMQGVLEHLDKPFSELQQLYSRHVKAGGCLITSSPSFLNPRGYVWMTLRLLFDVPMSLSDLHHLCPEDFSEFARQHGYDLETRSTDQDWGAGPRLLLDFQRRLPNALKDAGLPTDGVDRLLAWLEQATPYFETNAYTGVNVAYTLRRSVEGPQTGKTILTDGQGTQSADRS